MKFMKVQHIKNRFIGDFLYNKRRTRISNFPNLHSIESTNQCNLKCIMCPRKDMTRKSEFMDFSLFKKIIDECSEYVDFVYLHHFGEPLLHPHLIDMINYCGENNIKTGISTNGTLLSEDVSHKILDSTLDRIIFSLDGATQKTYEKIRRNAHFESTVSNIIRFLKLKKMKHLNRPLTTIQIILMNETAEETSLFYEKWRSHQVDSIEMKYFDSWAGQLKESVFLCKAEHRIPSHIQRYKQRQPCKWFWHNLIVLSDGTVVPCSRDYDRKIPLGNVSKASLKEIWNSDIMVKLREKQVQHDFENGLCDNCTEWVGAPKNPVYPLDINLYRGFRDYLAKEGVIKGGINTARLKQI